MGQVANPSRVPEIEFLQGRHFLRVSTRFLPTLYPLVIPSELEGSGFLRGRQKPKFLVAALLGMTVEKRKERRWKNFSEKGSYVSRCFKIASTLRKSPSVSTPTVSYGVSPT